MIYTDLEYLPYKILLKIIDTGNVRLLTDDDKITDAELKDIWEVIYKDYLSINPTNDTERIVKITREIYYNEAKYELILTYCKIMAFHYNPEVIDELMKFGYNLNHENYIDKIENIQREAQGLKMKAQNLRKKLPVIDENVARVSIDDMFASYSAILGIDFDYNTITVTKVIALGKQVDLKIKSYQKNSQDA